MTAQDYMNQAIVASQQPKGILGSLASIVTSPFGRAQRMGMEALYNLGNIADYKLTGNVDAAKNILKAQEFKDKGMGGLFLRPDELKQLTESPESAINFGAKIGAGLGSLLLPFIPGLGPVAGGLISGAMSGYSESEQGKELQGTLTGGGIGAGTGLLFSGLGKLGGGQLDDAATKLEGKNLGIGPIGGKGASPTAIQDAMQLTDDITTSLRSRGIGVNPAGIGEGYQAAYDDIAKALTGNIGAKSASTSNVLDDFLRNVADDSILRNSPGGREAIESVSNILAEDLSKLGPNPTAADIFNLKTNAQSKIRQALSKVAQGDMKTTLFDASLLKYEQALDNELARVAPEIKSLLQEQSLYRQAAPEVVGFARRGSGDMSLPFLTGSTKLPIGGLKERARSGVASAMRGLGNTPTIPAPVASVTALGLNQIANQQPTYQFNEQDLKTQGVNAQPLGMGDMGLAQPNVEAEFINLLNQGFSPTEAIKTLEFLGMGGGGDLTEKQTAFRDVSGSFERALAMLEGGNVETGKVANVRQKVQGFLGTIPEQEQAYRTTIGLARTQLRNALLGANMSPQEMQSIMEGIPEYSDEPAVARQKLITLIQELNYRSQGG